MRNKKLFEILLTASIVILSVYIIYPIYNKIFSWQVFLISIFFIIWFQVVKALFVKLTYKKILKSSSIAFTIFSIYIFGATLFYAMANLLIFILKKFF